MVKTIDESTVTALTVIKSTARQVDDDDDDDFCIGAHIQILLQYPFILEIIIRL